MKRKRYLPTKLRWHFTVNVEVMRVDLKGDVVGLPEPRLMINFFLFSSSVVSNFISFHCFITLVESQLCSRSNCCGDIKKGKGKICHFSPVMIVVEIISILLPPQKGPINSYPRGVYCLEAKTLSLTNHAGGEWANEFESHRKVIVYN